MRLTFWTVGHSNHPWKTFAALLATEEINRVVDIRSKPRSRFTHFNRQEIEKRLARKSVNYTWMGEPLGGRAASGGIVDYRTVAQTTEFAAALSALEKAARRERIALMCSEHEPLACHRFLLVARHLDERGHQINHILRDRCVETHAATERRLLAITRQDAPDLLIPDDERLARAYAARTATLARGP